MEDGWTRFQSSDVLNSSVTRSVFNDFRPHIWLSQANYIFRHRHILSNFEDYVLLDGIHFQLSISGTTGDLPSSFIFLCPEEDFRTGLSSFGWPSCPAYWSLDPSGMNHLSPEDATELGFPSFKLTTAAGVCSWDASVYDGLRQFHQAKGFDPESQDIARHLNYPLYQLSSEGIAHFACDGEDDSGWYTTDDKLESPCISACEDSDIDAESSHNEEVVHDQFNGSSGSEHTEISNCKHRYGK
ncbi:hypothetical protein B0H12DRAFT_235197 [Mycena haematopus]|nr:hypothetical protein B0H12DRAFT_235197 [Mycena haematopus]